MDDDDDFTSDDYDYEDCEYTPDPDEDFLYFDDDLVDWYDDDE